MSNKCFCGEEKKKRERKKKTPTGTTHQYTREALETVDRFSLSKLFPHYTLGTSHWGVFVLFFFQLHLCHFAVLVPLSHDGENKTKRKGKRIPFNRSKHVSVAEWIKKQLSLSCCASSAFVASWHARPILMSPSTFILITPRIACWHVLKSAAPRECAAKHSLHELSIWSTGSL